MHKQSACLYKQCITTRMYVLINNYVTTVFFKDHFGKLPVGYKCSEVLRMMYYDLKVFRKVTVCIRILSQ